MDIPSDLQHLFQLACREYGVEKILQVIRPEFYKENPTEFVDSSPVTSYSQFNEKIGSSDPLHFDPSHKLPVDTISCIEDHKENPTEFVDLSPVTSYSQFNEKIGSSYPLHFDPSHKLPVDTISCVEDYKENPTEFVDLSPVTRYSQFNEKIDSSYPLHFDPSHKLPVDTISCVRPIAAQYCRQPESGTSYPLEARRYSYEKQPPAQSNQQYVPGHPVMNDTPLNHHCDLNTPPIVSSSSNISQTVISQSIHEGTFYQVTRRPWLTETSILRRVPVATISVEQNSTNWTRYCLICEKEIPQRRALIGHYSTFSHLEKIKVVSSFSPHCKVCDKIFTTTGYLMQHNNAYHSDKPFKCKTCGKRFFTKADLDAHAEKHYDSNKGLMCEYCRRTFNYTSDLNRHESLHTGRGLWTCSCGKLFARRDHMTKHALFSCK